MKRILQNLREEKRNTHQNVFLKDQNKKEPTSKINILNRESEQHKISQEQHGVMMNAKSQ